MNTYPTEAVMQIPWQQMLKEIHQMGMQWEGIGRKLGCCESVVAAFVNRNMSFNITFDRGLWILHIHKTLCPVSFAQLAPGIKEHLRMQKGYEALRQIMEAH